MKKRGFSLVETLVAISILMISIAGPMLLVSNGIRASVFARDQITAFYLAQDALEAMRYIRDNNRIDKVVSSNPDSVSWDYLLNNSCTNASPCGVDTTKIYEGNSGGISSANKNKTLTINGSGEYGYYSSGTETSFKRWVAIREVTPGKEVEVVVTVDWSSGIIPRTFSIRENLFYWY